MNIKSIINKLFKNNNIDINEIATFANLIKIPKRDEFKNDLESINKIQNYKDKLLNTLIQNKTLTSNSLHFIDFQKELEMNLELLMKICFEEEWELLTNSEKSNKCLVAYAKLKLYLNKIIKLEKEIKYNYIALEEIKSKYLLRKRHVINEEKNNLLGILCSLNNQKNAIYHKINACSLEFKTYIENDFYKEKYIEDRYNKLMNYASKLISKDIIEDVNSYDNLIIKVAYLEKELEIYTYHNNKEIINIKESIEELKSKTNYLKVHDKKPIQLEEIINEIELKIRVFYEFGRNIIKEEDLENIYRIKFKYIVTGLYESNNSPFLSFFDENRDSLEYSIYERIISEILENLLTNKEHVLTWNFKSIDKDFWTSFSELFKYNESKIFDINYILTNKYVLLFLIATWEDDLYYYFHNQMIETPKYMKESTSDYFGLKYYISLSTFFKIMDIFFNDIPDGRTKLIFKGSSICYIEDFNSENCLIYLYELYCKLKDNLKGYSKKGVYYMPEGITKLLIFNHLKPEYISNKWLYKKENEKMDKETSYIIGKIMNDCDNKTVYFPSSLEEIDVELFNGIKFNKLYLNEGLKRVNDFHKKFVEDIYGFRMPCINVESLVIPSSLESFPWVEIDYRYLNEIIFLEYKDSFILNNINQIKNMFKRIVYVTDTKINVKVKKIIICGFPFDLDSLCMKVSRMNKDLVKAIIKKASKVAPSSLISNYDELLDRFIDKLIKDLIKQVYDIEGYELGITDNNKRLVKKA